jgi:hypothetical protein
MGGEGERGSDRPGTVTCWLTGEARPRPPGGAAVAWLRRVGREGRARPTRLPNDGSSAGRRVHRDLQVGAGRIAGAEGVDLLLDHTRVGGAVVAHHQHDIRTLGVEQARAAVDDPPGVDLPPGATTLDAAAPDTEPLGLNTIHQMVTAFPACSPVVDSEKAMPLSVRASVEVPTTAPAKVVTGLLVGMSAPARLMRTTESRPTRARATRIRRFTTLPPCGRRLDRKAGVSTNRSRRANWDDRASASSVRCDMQDLWQVSARVARSGLMRTPQKVGRYYCCVHFSSADCRTCLDLRDHNPNRTPGSSQLLEPDGQQPAVSGNR